MGACFCDRRLDAMSDVELRRSVEGLVASARAEYGSDPYSGTWATNSGLTIERHRLFDLFEDAQNYVTEQAQKRGPIVAVRVKDLPPFVEATEQGKGLAAKAKEAYSSWRAHAGEVLGRHRAEGAPFVCPHCGASIPIDRVRGIDCPVCHKAGALFTADELAEALRRKSAEEAARMALKAAAASWAAKQPVEPWFWYLGAWCAE